MSDPRHRLTVQPITFREAGAFIGLHHRHHTAPAGAKFCLSVIDGQGRLCGVATVGRPSSRVIQTREPLTVEVTRTCTDGTANANSALYGAAWRVARAMGYTRLITYTQEGETGASLRAAGWRCEGETRERGGWNRQARPRVDSHPIGVVRFRWERTA